MEYHEAANIFPLREDDIDDLAGDIKANGLLCPVELLDGRIIDGRRRWLACLRAGVKPDTCDVDVDDPVKYVWSLNFHRRHLSDSDQCVCAARAENLNEKYAAEAKTRMKQAKGRGVKVGPCGPTLKGKRARDELAKAFGTSGRMVQKAKRLLDPEKSIPEIIEAVDAGQIPVSVADAVAASPKAKQPEQLAVAIAGGKLKGASTGKREVGKRKREFDSRLPSKGYTLANEAINALSRIPKNDPNRKLGFQVVMDWIKSNMKG